MGNTVRTFASLGADRPRNEEKKQEGLGDALDNVGSESRLGDSLSGLFDEVDVDSVETVRELREDS